MKNELNLQQYCDSIESNIEKNLDVITSIVYHYNIDDVLNVLKGKSKKDKYEIYEMCINDYLSKIKNSTITFEQLKKYDFTNNEMVEFFYNRNDDVLVEEAENVVYDLLSKLFNENNRTIKLPISIDSIKDYSIHNVVNEKDIDKTIKFIIIYLSIGYYCIKNNIQ